MKATNYFAAYNRGTGLSWKGGPPRGTGAADKVALGDNYVPLARPGSPEPLLEHLGHDGCGCGGSCGGCGGGDGIVDMIMDAAILTVAGILIGKLLK